MGQLPPAGGVQRPLPRSLPPQLQMTNVKSLRFSLLSLHQCYRVLCSPYLQAAKAPGVLVSRGSRHVPPPRAAFVSSQPLILRRVVCIHDSVAAASLRRFCDTSVGLRPRCSDRCSGPPTSGPALAPNGRCMLVMPATFVHSYYMGCKNCGAISIAQSRGEGSRPSLAAACVCASNRLRRLRSSAASASGRRDLPQCLERLEAFLAARYPPKPLLAQQ